jgi:predicted nucleotidyltransferase
MPRIHPGYVDYVNKVVEDLKSDKSVVAVAVFGSIVKEKRKKPRDVDLMVVFKDRVNKDLLDALKQKYTDPPLHFFPRLVSDLKKFNALLFEIHFRGVILYDADGSFTRKLRAWKRKMEKMSGATLDENTTAIRIPFPVDPEQLVLRDEEEEKG